MGEEREGGKGVEEGGGLPKRTPRHSEYNAARSLTSQKDVAWHTVERNQSYAPRSSPGDGTHRLPPRNERALSA